MSYSRGGLPANTSRSVATATLSVRCPPRTTSSSASRPRSPVLDSRRDRPHRRRRSLPRHRRRARVRRDEPHRAASPRLRGVRDRHRRPHPCPVPRHQGGSREQTANPIRDEIQKAISEHEVILFMKGRPGAAHVRLQRPHGRGARLARRLLRGGRHPAGPAHPPGAVARSPTGRRSRSCSSTASSSAAATSSPRCTRRGELADTLGDRSRRPTLPRRPRSPPSRAPRPSRSETTSLRSARLAAAALASRPARQRADGAAELTRPRRGHRVARRARTVRSRRHEDGRVHGYNADVQFRSASMTKAMLHGRRAARRRRPPAHQRARHALLGPDDHRVRQQGRAQGLRERSATLGLSAVAQRGADAPLPPRRRASSRPASRPPTRRASSCASTGSFPPRHRAYARALLGGIIGPQRWGIAPVAQRRALRASSSRAAGARASPTRPRYSSGTVAGRARGPHDRRTALAYGRATLAGVATRVLAP